MATARAQLSALQQNHAILSFALRVLRPLARIFMRYDISVEQLTALCRWVFVDEALHHPEFRGSKKPSKSRASCLTGLSRKAVQHLCEVESPEQLITDSKSNRAAVVLRAWQQDERFTNSAGEPLELPITASRGVSFSQLCKEYCRDLPMRTVLDVLVRTGLVEIFGDGRVTIKSTLHNISKPDDLDFVVDAMTLHSGDFLATVAHNLNPKSQDDLQLAKQWFHPNVPIEKVPTLRLYIREQMMVAGHNIHTVLMEEADNKRHREKSYTRIGVGAYYFQD